MPCFTTVTNNALHWQPSQMYSDHFQNRLSAKFECRILIFTEVLPWSLTNPQIRTLFYLARLVSMGVRRNFSRGDNVDVLLIMFKCWRCSVNGPSQNVLPFPHHKQKWPKLRLQSQKNALRWQQNPGPRYITIIYTVGYMQIFKAEYVLSSKNCHNFKRKKHWHGLQLNHKLWLFLPSKQGRTKLIFSGRGKMIVAWCCT